MFFELPNKIVWIELPVVILEFGLSVLDNGAINLNDVVGYLRCIMM